MGVNVNELIATDTGEVSASGVLPEGFVEGRGPESITRAPDRTFLQRLVGYAKGDRRLLTIPRAEEDPYAGVDMRRLSDMGYSWEQIQKDFEALRSKEFFGGHGRYDQDRGMSMVLSAPFLFFGVPAVPGATGFAAKNLPSLVSLMADKPAETLLELGTFAFLQEYVSLKDHTPLNTPSVFKNAVGVIDFVKDALIANTGTKFVAGGLNRLVERFGVSKVMEAKLPNLLKITPGEIRDFYTKSGGVSNEVDTVLKEIGIKGESLKKALFEGIDIELPAENVVRYMDKPGFAKLKEILGLDKLAKEFPGDPLINVFAEKPTVSTKVGGVDVRRPVSGLLKGPSKLLRDMPEGFVVGTEKEISERIAAAPEATLREIGFPEPTQRPVDPVGQDTIKISDMPMRLARPKGEVPSTNASKIIDNLAEVVEAFGSKAPIRVGRITNKKFSGVFKVGPEVIRVRVANDVPTATHEVGHAIEKIIKVDLEQLEKSISKLMVEELKKLGEDLYGKNEPKNGYESEGIAEFVRMYVTNRTEAIEKAPNFAEYFITKFLPKNPKGAQALENAAKLTQTFQEQGAFLRAKESIISSGSLEERIKKIKAMFTKAVSFSSHVDMLDPINIFSKQAEEILGKRLVESENPFVIASALRTTHDARTATMINDAMIDVAGNIVGQPLKDIRGLVKGRKEDFTVYLAARRALALWQDPKGKRNPGIFLEDAKQIIKELETPEFQLAASKVYAWQEGVLNYAAQGSPSFAKVVERIRERDPGYYVPLARVFDQINSVLYKEGSRVALGTEGLVRKLTGSGRLLKDIFPQIISNARNIVKATHDRMVLDAIIKLSKIKGMGNLIEKVPVDRVPGAIRTLKDIINTVTKSVQDMGGEVDVLGIEDEDLVGETVTFFTGAHTPKGRDPIIPVWEEGKLSYYQVDQNMFEALKAMEVYRLPDIAGLPILDWIFGKPTRIFRAGTTGMRASFGLVTNPLRDIQTLWVNTQTNVNAVHLFGSWLSSMISAGAKAIGTDISDPNLEAFFRLGAQMAQPLGQDISYTRRATRRLFEGRMITTLDPRNWLDWYRDLVQFPESAARTTELKLLAKEIGWEPGEPMSLNQSLKLLLASKQVTTDFTAFGEFARVMNQIRPFYNAAIQGPRANIRAYKKNPVKFIFRTLAALTLPTLALWWAHKDEEWYNQLDEREKSLYWFIPIDWPTKALIRIPRSFEVGQIFASLPEAFMDAIYKQQPEIAKEWFDTFQEVTVPGLTPVLLEEAFEQKANRDSFWDTPIVSRALENMPEKEQFNEYTSSLAITLGDIFNVSPQRIDHAIKGLFGNVAGDIISVLGLGGEGVHKDPEAADTFLIGRLFKRGGELGTQPKDIQRLYESLQEMTKKQYSKKEPETQHERQVRLAVTDATKAISALFYVRSHTQETFRRENITREALDIAKDALKIVEKNRVSNLDRERFKARKKLAERREQLLKGRD